MRYLANILLIILFVFSCQESIDESNNKMAEQVEQQTDKLRHLPSINPIDGGKIIHRFGDQVDFLINNGIDVAVENEADVFAVADGKVADVKKGVLTDKNLIIIDHGYGFQTKYTNLSEIVVEPNQSVKRWSVIGKIKKPIDQPALLHYEVIKDGKPVDPEKFIF